MISKPLSIIIAFLFSIFSFCQEPEYFNNIYNPENTWAQGRGILQIDNWYYGIFGTNLYANSNYKLTVFKMDLSGNIVDWNTIGEDWHHYWMGILGGILIETTDGNLAFATHVSDTVYAHGVLIKLNKELEILWKKEYHSELTSPRTWKVRQTTDGGFIMVGIDYPGGTYYDGLLIKADSMGNEQWRQIYGVGTIYSEYLTNVIETPDNGYLIGGMRKKSEYLEHTLDAMVIKTDSLGNQEWVKYYGNPNVDDDMALLAVTDDGNYLVVTVYGEWVVSPTSRTGRIRLIKIDNSGTVIWDKLIGQKKRNIYLKNVRPTMDGNFIVAGWAYNDTVTEWVYEGVLYKFSQDGDSLWERQYNYFNYQYSMNFFYDAYPTSDNGYITIGSARPDMGDNKMWIVKVDSMGCDTPGCVTTVFSEELAVNSIKDLQIWPNPAKHMINVSFPGVFSTTGINNSSGTLSIYNTFGDKVKEVRIPRNCETLSIDIQDLTSGLYFIRYSNLEKSIAVKKLVVK